MFDNYDFPSFIKVQSGTIFIVKTNFLTMSNFHRKN